MKNTIIAAGLIAIAAATPAAAQNAANPAVSASPTAKAGARLIKPLTLTKLTDLNFGTIVLGTITGDQTVSVSRTGQISCPSGVGLTCTNTSQATAAAASYRITGTQGQVVVVSSKPSTLNIVGGTGSLTFTPIIPDNPVITLQNSGNAGNDFGVGGSITINSSTVDGVYSGDIDVQVAYQ